MRTLSEKHKAGGAHILFLISSLKFGGAERVVVNLSRFLAGEKRHRVTIMLLEDGIDFSLCGNVSVKVLHLTQKSAFSKIASLLCDPFRVKSFIGREGVDTVLSFMQRANAINMLAKALGSGHKAVVNVRCSLKAHYGRSLNILNRFFCWAIFKRLWHYADKTIVNSMVIKEEVLSLFGPGADTVELIYNPIDIEAVRKESQEEISENWFNEDIPVIINVSNLTAPKGHSYLLKAFARVAARRPVRLVLIGDGRLKDKLIRQAVKLGIIENLLFMGQRQNPYKYICRSDLFVLSSVYEGFPNVLLEAMACGCPVVSFDCRSGPSELLAADGRKEGGIVRARYGLLVKKTDDRALSDAIEEMLKNKKMSMDYARKGRERAQEFDLPIIAGRYEKIL